MITIKFKISKRRGVDVGNKFDARLSSYWKGKYYAMFGGW